MSAETILPTSKICAKCGVDKPLNEFSKRPNRPCGVRPKCKACEAAYYQANKARYAERDRAWRAANPGRSRDIGRKSDARPERKLAKAEWRKANTDKCHAYVAKYRQTAAGKAGAAQHAREHERRNPLKYRARRKIIDAVAKGRIQRQPCVVCGEPDAQAHHPDYSRPFFVAWLCRDHHKAVHDGALSVKAVQVIPD